MINYRELHQNKVAEIGREYSNIIVELPTGVGKTLACLKVISEDTSGVPWYIIVPEILQIENIKEEIYKQGFGYLLEEGSIEGIICYASFSSLEGKEVNLYFDEVHRLSELKKDIAKTVKFKRIIAASATIPKSVKQRLSSLSSFYNYSISLSQAIAEGILPEPKVYIVYTYPDNTVKKRYIIKKVGQYLTDKQRVKYFDDQIEKYNKLAFKLYTEGKNNDWVYRNITRIGAVRKAFVSSTKTEAVKELISERLENKRFICFTGSISQCDELGGDSSINSGKSKKHNLEVLQRLKDYKINSIYTNKMGREALNIPGIEAVVITQLSSGRDDGLELIQEIGRGLRAENPEIFIMVAKGTKDEDYLEKALKTIDKKYVEYVETQKTQR